MVKGEERSMNGLQEGVPQHVREWINHWADICEPQDIHIMDGTSEEDVALKKMLVRTGVLIHLPKYENCFLARTDPKDVARTESRTFISTQSEIESVPVTEKYSGKLGNWMSPQDLEAKVKELFPGCMAGRTMYVIPFSMGPIGSKLSKIGIEITDSAYVAVSMRIMTRVGAKVLQVLGEEGQFIKGVHSIGAPLAPGQQSVIWPCNPENVLVAHKPDTSEIISFGSGYGGNSLLGKKCLALRLGSAMARKEGWLAEHMLISGITNSQGEKKYIVAAFPSACGKTNLAMMQPRLPGYKVSVVGDDIAWLRPDEKGQLRAINPENGFFGVAPGTSYTSNPVAMQSIFKDTIFSNVAMTDDGGVWWEGMGDKPKSCIDWKGKPWRPTSSNPAAHPNSRFCTPLLNCPVLDESAEDPAGVPIAAILFGGRRPSGVPLVYQAISWEHGVFMGACVKSEATAAAEFKGKQIMHDPFSMRPFFGYNFGDYLRHWISMGKKLKIKPPVFMVNWFRRGHDGGLLWPGFGDNIRVIDWILGRAAGVLPASGRCVGWVPTCNGINVMDLDDRPDMDELLSTPTVFWKEEADEMRSYFREQVGSSLPKEMLDQLGNLERRIQVFTEYYADDEY
ncbi:phosphoenolpyruvate carboxykinase [GTP] isoform X2 [Eurytemora carolleeae]|uniref:phosphoenolpyruvate carboxykinase [GTP] isoform X1 n=1 Tax=Eurytemora carolleeae TaxID=1294199 RepID=UPI000C77ED8A|nr:phosphoenolpyruvate carboxykinase [GTP] isoform X1 [Eurytemora carolleeae]XP_023328241.1 phosphoenolpyruvate carboxykinase [GTP] isoform X2 [Eurytemora carolleeae]|eukprot:XP_023328240.1 phosphoenolpyruvate carboxykinase [GTP]-like isoform X1 [Eurytemora affinis]